MCHQNLVKYLGVIVFGLFQRVNLMIYIYSIHARINLFCKVWRSQFWYNWRAVYFVWSVLSKVSSDYYDSMLLDSKVICFSQYTTLQADNFAVLVSQLSNPNWTFVWESWKLANILPPNHHHHIKSDLKKMNLHIVRQA